MDCAKNIVTANFSGGKTNTTTAALWQWDYGQVLCVTGIEDLPQTFQMHFSLQQKVGMSTTVVGADGQVNIPNGYLIPGKPIYAWLYVSDEDNGETEYAITIPVRERPMPDHYEISSAGEFDGIVEQVAGYAATATEGAERSAASAAAADASAGDAATSASGALASATAAAQSAADAAQAAHDASGAGESASGYARAAAQSAAAAETAAQNAAQDAAQTAQDVGRAESAANRSEAAQASAEAAQAAAQASAGDAATSAGTATAKATDAAGSASDAAGSASDAAGSATAAQTAAGQAVAAKDAAVTAQTGAETAETNAEQSASIAIEKATEAAQSASDAQAAAARAEAAILDVDSALSTTSIKPVQNKAITKAIDDMQVIGSASGALVTFDDGADGIPVRSLTVDVSPEQDLNGQPNPYPGGGGNNQLEVKDTAGSISSGLTASVSNGTITINGNASTFTILIGNLATGFIGSGPSQNDGVNRFASGTYYLGGMVSGVRLQIYGSDSLGISDLHQIVSQDSVDGVITIDNPYAYSYCRLGVNAGEYTNLTCRPYLVPVDATHEWSPYSNICPITGHESVTVWREATYDTSADPALTIQLGQTVYGGTLDVTAGTVTVDRAMVDMGTLTWAVANATANIFQTDSLTDMQIPSARNAEGIICSALKISATTSLNTDMDDYAMLRATNLARLYVRDTSYSDAASFKAAMQGVQLCYELATPQTITLTPQEMTTLLGYNAIWSDGDSLSVEYVRDTKASYYIQSMAGGDTEVDDALSDTSENPVENRVITGTVNALDDAIKAGQIIAEGSGGVTVIEDGALNMPVRRMDVEIEYDQDLHGQGSPYPAGGGKNLLPYFSNGVTTAGVTFTVDEYGVVTANGTATGGNATMVLVVSTLSGNYYFNGAYGGSGSTYNMFVWDVTAGDRCKKWDGSTASANGYDTFEEVQIVQGHGTRFSLRVMSGYTANNIKFYPMLCRDTESDESYAPYSNICPITGVDTLTVHQSGRNLFDEANAVIYPRFFTTAKTWVFAADSTSVAFPCMAGEYTVSAYNSELTIFRVGTIDHLPVDNSDTPAISNVTRMTSSGSVTIIPDSGAKYIIIQCSKRIMDEGTANIQIELGSTPSDYEPYYGRTISVPLGQTVYGGNCTVTSGALDVTSGYMDLGTLTWTYNAGYGDFSATVPGMWTGYNWADSVSNLATTVYGYNDYAERGADMPDYTFSVLQDTIVVKDPRYTDATAFTAAVSGVFFTYMLDAPARTQLPPQVVRTYSGYNAFWSNGVYIVIDYVVDTGKAIEDGVNSVRDFVVHAIEKDPDIEGEEGYNVEESLADVAAAYNSGKSVFCRVTPLSGTSEIILPLSRVTMSVDTDERTFWFSGIDANSADGYIYRSNGFERVSTIYGVKATAIAPLWSESELYTVGDYVMADPYDTNTFDLYKCITDTSGDFDSSAWEITTVYDMVRDMINQ